MTRDVSETHVLSRLKETNLKLFSWTNKTCRDAVRRWKKDEEAEKKVKFKVKEMVLSSISVLEWAWERIPFKTDGWKRSFIALVALAGNVELVHWLREVKKCTWDERTCYGAVWNGHLECLKYANENGCPWHERTCKIATSNGHFTCLTYVRENGCPWDSRTVEASRIHVHNDCFI